MKLKLFFLLLSTLLIVHSSLLIGTIRYVSKTGTSTPPYTSWQTAADSIQKCINICSFGDTVYVASGVYKENLVINTAISLIGSSMDSTIIDGRGLSDFTIVYNDSGSIQLFSIYGKSNGTGYGIYGITNSPTVIIKDCRISQTGRGIAVSGLNAKNILMKELRSGIINSANPNTENYISNCIMISSSEGSNGINISGPTNANYNINNNIILFTGTINPDAGISIGAPRKVNISNNLISGFNTSIFFDIVFESSSIINSLILHSKGQNTTILSQNDNLIMRNNVLSDAHTSVWGSGIDLDYNIFWKNIYNVSGTVTLGDSDIVADPMFVKDTVANPELDFDYHLQAYSPAIDKGDPSILDVDGSRSDIGLFGGPYGQIYTYQDLAPKPPANLTASMDSGLVHLKWNKNTEADIFRYRVYRDTVPDFIYDTTKIIAVLSDTTFYDDPPQKFISGNYYYKITAIDSAYHQSPASEEVHINITGIPEAPPIVVEHYNLLQNYPNPFNPGTTIPYRLKAPGYVKVMVYNLLGEQVKVLVNKYQSAGYYEVLFHPTATERQSSEGYVEFETFVRGGIVSGVYLYRIEVIGEGNIPVFTDMKKMLMIK